MENFICTDTELTGCTWPGKALNRSAIPNNLPEFWLVTENWIILPNHQANLHTCQGFENNAICDLQMRNYTKKILKMAIRLSSQFWRSPVYQTNYTINFSILLETKPNTKESVRETANGVKMEIYRTI